MTDTTDIAQPATADGDGAAPARRAPLSQLRLGQLQELASSLGVAGTATMRKSDLLAAIRAEQGTSSRARRADRETEPPASGRSRQETSPAQGAQAPAADAGTGRTSGPPQPRRGDDDGVSGAAGPAGAATGPAPAGDDAGADQGPSRRTRGRRAERAAGAPGAGGPATEDRRGETDGRPEGGRPDGRSHEGTPQVQERTPERAQERTQERTTERPTSERGTSERGGRPEARLDARAQLEQSLDLRERARHRRGETSEGADGAGREGQGGQESRQDRGDQGDRQRQRDDRPRDERQRDDRQGGGQQDRGQDSRETSDDDELGGRRGRRGRYRDRKRRGRDGVGGQGGQGGQAQDAEPEVSDDDVLTPVAGVLDVLDSYAFVRTSGYLPGPNDVYVTLAQVKKHGMRKGDVVTGAVRARGDGDGDGQDAPGGSGRGGRQQRQQRAQKFNPLVRVDTVNGLQPDGARRRPDFTKLTPLYPQDRLRLETERGQYTQRVIDLVAPIGKGQRGLIVAPPKAGKTIVMQQIANAITRNNPDVHLMVVLVDERPEEVTDMQRTVKGEVIASTFDRPAEDHTTVAELAIERAKRLVELGHDVVVLLDSLTRLSRAYNTSAPASGRILSGGIDASALYPPKRFFGAARNIENGGSLTILASALVETGSKADEVIFEEFKGTGNMELRLARHLADKRIFPAVDVNASGTRREEILMSPEELKVVYKLRRVLGALDSTQAIELVLGKLRETGSNAEFLMQVQRTAPAGPGGDAASELTPRG
ncbi:transcription termination factor Rho [Pseudokineococcus basanitobsidens]|uniref:Transcription termination factor Rho n=1 Tax=Pseudokineococcus basanitobsidens TaxID=1926649 RepID=A0ABU8RIG3_9ACTN